MVATNDTHYLNSDDAEAHDILICLQTKKTINEKNRMSYLGEDFSLYTNEKMADAFRSNPEVLENTVKISEKCNLEIPLGEIQLPYFAVPEGKTYTQQLKDMCYQGVKKRYGFDPLAEDLTDKQKNALDRLDYELGVIEKIGYDSYFLIVHDFIRWAKEQEIVVGPGRGSAAGSVVAYLLQITNIDPLHYDLLFERFLNPDRVSMPDIDIDFADERREEVLGYVEKKYGQDHVAQIITFGTLAARAAVKDVGRVLDMPYSFCDKISKLIPMNVNLDEAITKISEVRNIYETNDEARRLLDFAKKLEGVARHASTHACGVVITRDPLDKYSPVQFSRDKDDVVVSQYSLHPIEDLGLLKMDFLGLKNLTIIERACNIIEKIHGRKIVVDDLGLDDKKTYDLFQKGHTTGVFQFESSGMKRYLKMLKPNNLEDLIAMVALYRPGPLNSGMADEFIARKHGEKEITYLHPLMKGSLENTYGVIVYQEQVMQLSKVMAGFTGGQADTLRKAMGKKIADLMEKMKKEFLQGCANNNLPKNIAEQTFENMEKFAEYGFNKSHAACYALIAYQTAYLKANYPAEFMASLLTSDQNNMDRVAIEIDECQQRGIEILPPSVNESFSTFTVVAETLNTGNPRIRFGLNAVRNVGKNVAKAIIHERKESGKYKDLDDFLFRVGGENLNKKSLEGLIKSGAMDVFGKRSELLGNLEKMILYIKEMEAGKASNQRDIFSINASPEDARPKLNLKEIEDYGLTQILAWEKEFLGLYVSEHPFSKYRDKLKGKVTELIELRSENIGDKRPVKAAGVITGIKKIMTKKGDPMLFIKIDDSLANVECLIFPRLYKEKENIWEEGNILLIDGTVSLKDGEVKVLANNAWQIRNENFKENLDEFQNYSHEKSAGLRKSNSKKVVVKYPTGADESFASQVKMLFISVPGKYQVCLKVGGKMVKTQFFIDLSFESKKKIFSVLGPDCILGIK